MDKQALKLYAFLSKGWIDTGLYENKNGELIGFAHIPFDELGRFVQIVGSYPFEEGGLEVRMFDNTICIELNEIIESFCAELADFSELFDCWDEYEKAGDTNA